jgi:hypothetical protein
MIVSGEIFAVADAFENGVSRALSRGEGCKRREHGERQQLLGEEHISVVLMRVGAPTGDERGSKCLLI